MAFHYRLQFWRRRLERGQHRINVINVGSNRHRMTPILCRVIHDVGSPHHGGNGIGSLFLEAEPLIYIGNIVSDNHLWHRPIPLSALSKFGTEPPVYHKSCSWRSPLTSHRAAFLRSPTTEIPLVKVSKSPSRSRYRQRIRDSPDLDY